MRSIATCAFLVFLCTACAAPEPGAPRAAATRDAAAAVDAAPGAPPRVPATSTDAADAAAPAGFDGATIPARFHGVYAATGACGPDGDESRLEVTADAVRFHESHGRVLRARGEADALAATLALEGEGQSWEREVRFRLEGDGRRLVDADGGLARERCPAKAR